MAIVQHSRQYLVGFVMVAAALAAVVTTVTAQDNGKREQGQGKYGQLSGQWWRWILEQPITGNPNFDPTGDDAANGQPRADVFFVAGSFGGTATREFTVPAGAALFFPLLNNLVFAPKPAPQPKELGNQVPQLRALATSLTDGVTELHVTLDEGRGPVSLINSVTRVKSPVFKFTSPNEDGLLDPGTFTAVSDGYWLFLSPLPAGTYVLNFGGTSDGFSLDITDTITVQ